LLDQTLTFCGEHPRQWDRLLPALSLAYSTCPHRAPSFVLFDLLIPRCMPNRTVEGLTGSSPLASADGSPLTVERVIIHGLKKLIPTVRVSIDKHHSLFKTRWDGHLRPKNKEQSVGDFVYLCSHRGGHKLLPKTLAPFAIINTDGTYFAIGQGDDQARVHSFPESGFFIEIRDVSRYTQIYPLESFGHPM